MTGGLVTYEKNARIATLTLGDPARRNALGPEMRDALAAGARRAAEDADVRAVVVTGSGGFFATDDVKGRARAGVADRRVRLARVVAPPLDAFAALRLAAKPAIAALSGSVEGEGLDLALACDVRIGAEDLRLDPRSVSAAVLPRQAALLTRVLGWGNARSLLLSGEVIDSAEAERIGFIDQLVSPASLVETATRLALRIANGPPVALAFTRQIIYRGLTATGDDQYAFTVLARTLLFRLTEETREGFDSFVEKRPPVF